MKNGRKVKKKKKNERKDQPILFYDISPPYSLQTQECNNICQYITYVIYFISNYIFYSFFYLTEYHIYENNFRKYKIHWLFVCIKPVIL